MSKLSHSCDETMEEIERAAERHDYPTEIKERRMTERHVPVPLSACLRTIAALRSENLSPAEKDELAAAASLLELAYPALRELCQRIEKCGASVELTHAVTLCSDLCSAIGNQWNPRDKQAQHRVHVELGIPE